MSRIVIPSSTDWLQSADFNSGTVLVEGRLAELLHPEIWRDAVFASSHRLDAAVNDYSGNHNRGARAGPVGDREESWLLLGPLAPSHISIADRENLAFGAGVLFSGSVWVRTLQSGASWSLFAKVDQDVTAGFSLIYDTALSALRFGLNDGGGNNTSYDGTTDVADDAWHHVGFVVHSRNATPGADDVELYVDGAAEGTLNASDVGTNQDVTNALALLLGARSVSSSLTNFLGGQIADPLLHRRALTAAEFRLLSEHRGIAYECRLHPRPFFFP